MKKIVYLSSILLFLSHCTLPNLYFTESQPENLDEATSIPSKYHGDYIDISLNNKILDSIVSLQNSKDPNKYLLMINQLYSLKKDILENDFTIISDYTIINGQGDDEPWVSNWFVTKGYDSVVEKDEVMGLPISQFAGYSFPGFDMKILLEEDGKFAPKNDSLTRTIMKVDGNRLYLNTSTSTPEDENAWHLSVIEKTDGVLTFSKVFYLNENNLNILKDNIVEQWTEDGDDDALYRLSDMTLYDINSLISDMTLSILCEKDKIFDKSYMFTDRFYECIEKDLDLTENEINAIKATEAILLNMNNTYYINNK